MTLGQLTYQIKIGTRYLKGVTKVEIANAMEALSTTARIELPAYINNAPYQFDTVVKRGMEVEIRLGYDGKNVLEFTGYVRSISMNSPCIIECEDEMYRFRKEVKSGVYEDKSVDAILNDVARQTGVKVNSKVGELKYDKFVVTQATGYEVLQKIQEQFRITLKMREGTLLANYLYAQTTGNAQLDFSKNIKASSLAYVDAEDLKVQVKIRGIGADNKPTKEITAGERGGEIVQLPDRINVTNEKALQLIAREELKRVSYTGYRGELTIWGLPRVEAGYAVQLRDEDYPERNGVYYVKAVKIQFSNTGFERQLTLGQRLS